MKKADELVEMLRKKYPAPAHSVLEQVRSCTGYAKEIRTCDAMAMSLWPGRGIWLAGFEIKVSRSDWLKELSEPSKADGFQSLCHRWYLLTSDDKVAQIDEIPETWGWMVQQNGTLRTLKESKYNPNPQLDHYFLASVFRNVTEGYISAKKHQELMSKQYDEGFKSGMREHNELLEKIREFEQISGVEIVSKESYIEGRIVWNYEEIGQAVKMVLDSKHLHIKRQLEEFKEDVGRILEQTNKALEGIQK